MQVTETLSQGLKREFQVVLPASELEERLSSELSTLKDRVKINGFRPGKVPVGHLRRLYGRSVMAEVVQTAVTEAERKIVEDHKLKLANQPKYEFPEDKDAMDQALDAKIDLSFKVAMEILPQFELADISDVSLTKPVVEISDTEVEEALARMAKQNQAYESSEGAKAETGDRIVVDFVGEIAGEKFEGSAAEGIKVDIGSNGFIPGFEEQLIGLKAGDESTVTVTFPVNYAAEHLAGKEAVFAVTTKDVQKPVDKAIDDEMAKTFGMDSLDALKDALRTAIKRDFDTHSRRKLKKALLDALDEKYDFDLPPSLVEQEFAAVWSQVMADLTNSGKTFADEDTTEEAARGEYQKIAERRVRLGLVLAQIGENAEIKVGDDEVTQALIERVRQYPGQEQQVWEFYQKNPQALAEIRAPLFEEKVVDHILAQVKVTEATVTKEALFADEGAEEAASAEAEGAEKAEPKKKGKAKSKKAESEEG